MAPAQLLLLAALALASPVAPLPRVAIAPVRGDRVGALADQLDGALCPAFHCLRGELGGPRPDLAKARRAGAQGSLLSSVWREPTRLVISLALFTEGARPARTWVLPLDEDGRLSPRDLARLAAEIGAALGVEAPPRPPPAEPRAGEPAPTVPPPQAPPPPPPWRAAAPSGPRPAPPPAGTPARPEPARPPSAEPAPPSGPSGADRPPRAPPRLSLAAGVGTGRLTLGFPAEGTAPVGYAVDLAGTLWLRADWYPLRARGGAAAGLALLAEGGYLGGVKLTSGARVHPAEYLRLRAGLAWRAAATSWLTALPALACELERFTVAPVEGVRPPGLPDTRLAGFSAGLGLEVPVGRTAFTVLASGRLTWWLQAAELAGGARFYPGGAAHGLEAEAGGALALGGPLSLRITGGVATTRWALDADPSGAYSVRSAQGETWQVRAWLAIEP